MKKVLERLESALRPATGDARFTTISGRPIESVYRPLDAAGLDYARDLGDPGQYPFTRHPRDDVPGQGLDDAAVRRLR